MSFVGSNSLKIEYNASDLLLQWHLINFKNLLSQLNFYLINHYVDCEYASYKIYTIEFFY